MTDSNHPVSWYLILIEKFLSALQQLPNLQKSNFLVQYVNIKNETATIKVSNVKQKNISINLLNDIYKTPSAIEIKTIARITFSK